LFCQSAQNKIVWLIGWRNNKEKMFCLLWKCMLKTFIWITFFPDEFYTVAHTFHHAYTLSLCTLCFKWTAFIVEKGPRQKDKFNSLSCSKYTWLYFIKLLSCRCLYLS